MILIDGYRVKMEGSAAELLAEITMGLRSIRKEMLKHDCEENVDKNLDAVLSDAKMSINDMLKKIFMSDNEYLKAMALFYCEQKAKTDDDMLDFLGELVEELKGKEKK